MKEDGKGGSKIRSDRKSKNNITEVCRVMLQHDDVGKNFFGMIPERSCQVASLCSCKGGAQTFRDIHFLIFFCLVVK